MIDPFTSSKTSTSERRRFIRVPFLQPVTLTLADGRTIAARTTDISNGGVGTLCRASPRLGDQVVVTFRLKDLRHRKSEEHVPGRVVNFQADLDANRVGVEFNDVLHPSVFPVLVGVVGRL